ncbi:hypothetical protein [Virgisporangium aurantiacum]|uniref:Uncharacterized protein n=1 Tax=Virgisporangium aurantiacum TaxID=175570 RepID=A0A8J4E3Y4_9ACTN|nr:hypothetical protein [Virgisporangium aurantiacum]GIJ60433.1 hypothetical protein Vau01_079490 [Virgisporangium aurantiacum]
MPRKPFTLRQTFLGGAALIAGSGVGTLAEAVTTRSGHTYPGVGQVAAAAAALWVLEKLNLLIDDDTE